METNTAVAEAAALMTEVDNEALLATANLHSELHHTVVQGLFGECERRLVEGSMTTEEFVATLAAAGNAGRRRLQRLAQAASAQ